MATKRTKYYYYILVFTSEGPKYVTGIGEHRTAEWDMLKKPKEFSSEYADDVVLGLTLNGFNAVKVQMKWEVENQPHRYEIGVMQFIRNEDKTEKESE